MRGIIQLLFFKLCSILATIIDNISLRREKKHPLWKRNIHYVLLERATQKSADFVEPYLDHTIVFKNRAELWDYVIEKINKKHQSGICLEFGVFKGGSINWFSDQLANFQFYGFDSFEGLKEDWTGLFITKGEFSLSGVKPKVNKNVVLIKGFFEDTLSSFVDSNNLDDLKFLHIDSDTYNAAKIVLDLLSSHLKSGTLILFDDFLGFPNWENGEYKALKEMKDNNKFDYRFLAFSNNQALIEIY